MINLIRVYCHSVHARLKLQAPMGLCLVSFCNNSQLCASVCWRESETMHKPGFCQHILQHPTPRLLWIWHVQPQDTTWYWMVVPRTPPLCPHCLCGPCIEWRSHRISSFVLFMRNVHEKRYRLYRKFWQLWTILGFGFWHHPTYLLRKQTRAILHEEREITPQCIQDVR